MCPLKPLKIIVSALIVGRPLGACCEAITLWLFNIAMENNHF
jgi:hypothetical protein